jgi:hypothetical protein
MHAWRLNTQAFNSRELNAIPLVPGEGNTLPCRMDRRTRTPLNNRPRHPYPGRLLPCLVRTRIEGQAKNSKSSSRKK